MRNTEPESSDQAYRYALRLLAARDYTASRLREKLAAREFAEDSAASVIKRLDAEGWINDRRFAERFAESAVASGRFYGPRLRQEMRRRGVPLELADEVLGSIREEHDEVCEVSTVIARRYPGFSFQAAGDKEKRRVVGFLQRRGFGLSAIMRALREFTSTGDNRP